MRYARFSDVELAYDTAGEDGTPVLLIMGFAVRGLAWRRQVPALAERHQVAWFDNRGAGETRAPRRPLTLGRLADDAARLLDHLEHERAHVVGISMGGMIAQHLALRHPDRLRSLSLIATHAGGRRAMVPPRSGLGLFLRANRRCQGRGEATLRLLMTDAFLEQADTAQLLRDISEDFGSSTLRDRLMQLGAVGVHDTRRRLRRLAGLPTLIIQPDSDRLIHPRHSADLAARIPGARLLTVPGTGHGILRERPTVVNEALLDHFAGVDRA